MPLLSIPDASLIRSYMLCNKLRSVLPAKAGVQKYQMVTPAFDGLTILYDACIYFFESG